MERADQECMISVNRTQVSGVCADQECMLSVNRTQVSGVCADQECMLSVTLQESGKGYMC